MWNPNDHFEIRKLMRIFLWQIFVFYLRILVTFREELRLETAFHFSLRSLCVTCASQCPLFNHPRSSWDDKIIFLVNNSCYQLWIYYDPYCLHNHRVVVTVSTKSVAPYSILSKSIEHTVTLTEMRVSFTPSTAEMLSINLWDFCL